jgi:hypothetical protein
MAVTLRELVTSRSWSYTSGELNYVLTGTNSDTTALQALAAATPLNRSGLVRSNFAVEPVGDPVESEMWIGTATYGSVTLGSTETTGKKSESFNTGGGTRHITTSIETKATTPDAPNFQTAIGVNRNGDNLDVEGVDITEPVFTFQETWDVEASDVTDSYKGVLFTLTGKVNDATFRGCAAGECLFLGASGTQRNEDMYEITFSFAASPNNASYPIMGTTINKDGWDYVWVLFQEQKDEDALVTVKVPKAAYVEKVYQSGDLSSLFDFGS